MRWSIAAIVALELFSSRIATAQQVIPPGQLRIGGFPVNCGNIPTVVQPINDVAIARPGAIILNPTFFSRPPVLQLFIYAHECAHHILGSNEAAADCWAIRTGRNQGWFTPQDFQWLIVEFGNSPGDWTHAPGPQRLDNMARCYAS